MNPLPDVRFLNRREGGKKAAVKNTTKDPDFYKRIGSKGGKTKRSVPTGFAANPELARIAGAKGGKVSRRRNDRLYDEKLKNELRAIAERIVALGEPREDSPRIVIGRARKLAAKELHRLGYSYREIAKALGLKSPHSIGLYVKDKSADA